MRIVTKNIELDLQGLFKNPSWFVRIGRRQFYWDRTQGFVRD